MTGIQDIATNPVTFALMIGAACAVATLAAMLLSNPFSNPLRRRLRALQEPEQAEQAPAGDIPEWLGRLQPYLQPRTRERRESLRLRLQHAGYRGAGGLTLMYAAKVFCALVLAVAVAVLCAVSRPPGLTNGLVLLLTLISGGFGWLVPNMMIDRRVAKRQRVLMEGLPDALDLLVACTEAGLGLNAAIQRVADQLPASHPLLAAELAQVNAQIRAGVDRIVALRSLAQRTGLDEIRGLVSLMTQSMRYGTSIADTLRIYAEEFRDRRMQRAEETAATIGTRLIFPLCFCIFPAFFIVMVGPAVIGVVRVMGGVEWPAMN
jgi:tight adherence protein C